jgi:hypothetical protein
MTNKLTIGTIAARDIQSLLDVASPATLEALADDLGRLADKLETYAANEEDEDDDACPTCGNLPDEDGVDEECDDVA